MLLTGWLIELGALVQMGAERAGFAAAKEITVPSGPVMEIDLSEGLREGVHGLCELGVSALDGHFLFEYLAPQGLFDVLL